MKAFSRWSLGLILILTTVFASTQALAHTGLKSSEPVDGATLAQSPEELKLNFAAKVTLLKVELRNQAGETVPLDFKPSAKAEQDYTIQLPTLAPAAYTLTWTALGGDGHKLEKSFSFAIGPHTPAAAEDHKHHH